MHFHVPIFVAGYGDLARRRTTAPHASSSRATARSRSQLEIETYTWDVLPADLKADLAVESIAREYAWVLDVLG